MKSNQLRQPLEKISIITGKTMSDQRGDVSFVNGFDFKGVKRFYQIKNSSLNVVRAFHGHLKETKYFYVVSGSILLAAVYIDDPKSPNKNTHVHKIILSHQKPSIVRIPPSYANGFKSLEENTTIVVFSTSSLRESLSDDYRYSWDYWGKEVWD